MLAPGAPRCATDDRPVLSQPRSPCISAELRSLRRPGLVGSGDGAVLTPASVPYSAGRQLAWSPTRPSDRVFADREPRAPSAPRSPASSVHGRRATASRLNRKAAGPKSARRGGVARDAGDYPPVVPRERCREIRRESFAERCAPADGSRREGEAASGDGSREPDVGVHAASWRDQEPGLRPRAVHNPANPQGARHRTGSAPREDVDLKTRRVHVAGVTSHADGTWMAQIARISPMPLPRPRVTHLWHEERL